MRWKYLEEPDPKIVERFAAEIGRKKPQPIEFAKLCVQRGIHNFDEAKSFFAPQIDELHDPYLMKDMEKAVNQLVEAYSKQEKILLYGDYDVDGTSAVSLLYLFMQAWGFDFDYYIPDRYKEGYGISFQGIDHAVNMEAKLMVSLDCGIKALEKIKYANEKGVEVIVCDHHRPGNELPKAFAILDPKQEGCQYPYKELTGCGVGFKLITAVHEKLLENGFIPKDQKLTTPFEAYADLVTLSIACDIVPITGENRAIASFGLKKLKSNPIPGIAAIKSLSQRDREWDISDLVFFLGPRINAAGRLGQAKDAVEVLLGTSKDLIALASSLDSSNLARQEIDQAMTQEALGMINTDPSFAQKSTTVLYQPEWHKGVIGIVASRVIETHYRPTVLLTQSEGKLVGSARSVNGFDLYQALDKCQEYLLQFGGHKYAAGLSIKEENLDAFKNAFDVAVSSTIQSSQKEPEICIDQELNFSKIDARFIRLINRLAPFGPQNHRPIFVTKKVLVRKSNILKEHHLKLVLEQSRVLLEAIGFNLAEKWNEINGDYIDIVYQPFFNVWNDKVRIQLRIKDLKAAHVN